VQVVFYQLVLSYVLLFFLSILFEYEKKERLTIGLFGPVGFIIMGFTNLLVIRVRRLFLILSYLLAAGCLFIPFHNMIFNIVFFLYFFTGGQLPFEFSNIDFALFYIEPVKKIQELLNEGLNRDL
jgi:hypothetical protein